MKRRTVLGSVGTTVTLGTAGCLASIGLGAEQADDALVDEGDGEGTMLEKHYSFDFEEGQWAHKVYTIHGVEKMALVPRMESGTAAFAVMTHADYKNRYRNGGGEPGSIVVSKPGDDYQDARIEIDGETDVAIVVDNTGYFEDHKPDGRAIGDASFSERV